MKNYQITLTSFIWSLYQRTADNYSISMPKLITLWICVLYDCKKNRFICWFLGSKI